MNPFPSDAFKNAMRGRTVECVPLLDITLVDGATGFVSDRRVTVGSTTYLPRIVRWGPVSDRIDGSSSTATFALSNVDRVMELAARDHMFQRARVLFKAYSPAAVAAGATPDQATRIVWHGYVDKTPYDHEIFTLSCKAGSWDLTLPLPRRRFSRNCDLEFDDGLYCPYSGFGMTGSASDFVPVSDLTGVFAEAGVSKDFGPDLSATEGYRANPGYSECDKSFSACKARGMARFYGGLRFVTAWSTGRLGAGGFTGAFTGGDPYTSYSSLNETIVDQAVPLLYCGSETGFTMNPMVLSWRPEGDFIAAECVVSEGPIGSNPEIGFPEWQQGGIKDVTLNGKLPHKGEFPAIRGDGVARSPGRIGEPYLWTELEGDMWKTDTPGDPPIYVSSRSGFFARIKENEAGVNSPKADASTGTSSAPTIYANVMQGRRVWQYTSPTSRTYGPSGNPVWIILDMVLEAYNVKYATIARHASLVDLQSFIDFAQYAGAEMTSMLTGTVVQRYRFAGQFNDLKPAMDQVDSALRDCHGFRFWRNGLFAVRGFMACQDPVVRPAFQEFVNVKHNSFKPEVPNAGYNELNLNFADADFDFQKNIATVYSIDYQKMLGVNGHPFKQAQSYNLTGTCLTEQSVRIGLRMMRQELGGTSPTQWAQVRNATLESTFLMSELEVGDITYLAHTLMPNGGDWIRIEEWSLQEDWAMSFKFRSWRSSAYDDILANDPSVELAKFPRNIYIRSSRGIVYPPLPKLEWDPVSPIVSTIFDGVKLSWVNYTDPALLSMLHGVMVFRTTVPYLGSGGYLMEEVDGAKTQWKIASLFADFETIAADGRNVYVVGSEKVAVTGYADNGDGTSTLTVTRGAFGSNPESHQKYDAILHQSFLDSMPHPSQVQGRIRPTQYVDPWEDTSTTTTSTTTTT